MQVAPHTLLSRLRGQGRTPISPRLYLPSRWGVHGHVCLEEGVPKRSAMFYLSLEPLICGTASGLTVASKAYRNLLPENCLCSTSRPFPSLSTPSSPSPPSAQPGPCTCGSCAWETSVLTPHLSGLIQMSLSRASHVK